MWLTWSSGLPTLFQNAPPKNSGGKKSEISGFIFSEIALFFRFSRDFKIFRFFWFYFCWNCLIFPEFPRFPKIFRSTEPSEKKVGNPRWSVSFNILFYLRADEFADKHVISQRSAIIVEVTTVTSAFVCKILSHYIEVILLQCWICSLASHRQYW